MDLNYNDCILSGHVMIDEDVKTSFYLYCIDINVN